jgi:hypothetical protein
MRAGRSRSKTQSKKRILRINRYFFFSIWRHPGL